MGLALARAVAEGVLHFDQEGQPPQYCLPDYRPGGLHNRLPAGASSAAAAADAADADAAAADAAAAAAAASRIRAEAAAARATGVRGGDVGDVGDVRLKRAKAEVLPGGGGGGGPLLQNCSPRPGPSWAEEFDGRQRRQQQQLKQQQVAESRDKENQDDENRAARRRLPLRAPLVSAPLSSHQLGRLERPSPLRCAGTVRHEAVIVPMGGGLDNGLLTPRG